MESKQHAPSVIARLMGLDDFPHQKPVHRQRPVLSENYFRKIASIRLLEKQSHSRRLVRENSVKRQKFKEMFGVPEAKANSCTIEPKFAFEKQQFTDAKHASLYKKLQSAPLKNEIRSESRRTARGIVLRSLRKLENESGLDYFRELGFNYSNRLIKSELDYKFGSSLSPRSIVVLKPNSVAGQSFARSSLSPSSPKASQLDYAKHNEVISVRIGEFHHELVERKNSANVTEPSKHSFRFAREFGKETSRETRHRNSSSSENVSQGMVHSCPNLFDWKNRHESSSSSSSSPSILNGPSFAMEAKNGYSKGRKLAKRSQEVGLACKSSTLAEMLAMHDQETMPRNLNGKCDKHGLNSKPSDSRFRSEESNSFSCLDSEKNTIVQDMSLVFKMENKHFNHGVFKENSVLSKLPSLNAPRENLEYNHEVQETQVIQGELEMSFGEYELFGCHEKPESETFPHILEASISQESSVRSPEAALVHSNCHRIGLELPLSLGEGYVPSPISVLEPPFIEEVSGSECFDNFSSDLYGLRMQLQLLFESEEAYSEGSEMVVSSDEDGGEESFDLSKERKYQLGLSRAKEIRDFCYLVDVLDEAIRIANLDIANFKNWHSPELPISPSVFEILEKKFGEQMSWERSERRLLFDRINSGLMEIFETCREKPLSRRMKLNLLWSREVIEDELWMSLVSQEKEVSKDLSEKVLGEELRWSEYVDVIGREIERFLFDELVAELESIESC